MHERTEGAIDILLIGCQAFYAILMPAGLLAFMLSVPMLPFVGTGYFALTYTFMTPIALLVTLFIAGRLGALPAFARAQSAPDDAPTARASTASPGTPRPERALRERLELYGHALHRARKAHRHSMLALGLHVAFGIGLTGAFGAWIPSITSETTRFGASGADRFLLLAWWIFLVAWAFMLWRVLRSTAKDAARRERFANAHDRLSERLPAARGDLSLVRDDAQLEGALSPADEHIGGLTVLG